MVGDFNGRSLNDAVDWLRAGGRSPGFGRNPVRGAATARKRESLRYAPIGGSATHKSEVPVMPFIPFGPLHWPAHELGWKPGKRVLTTVLTTVSRWKAYAQIVIRSDALHADRIGNGSSRGIGAVLRRQPVFVLVRSAQRAIDLCR